MTLIVKYFFSLLFDQKMKQLMSCYCVYLCVYGDFLFILIFINNYKIFIQIIMEIIYYLLTLDVQFFKQKYKKVIIINKIYESN